MEISAELHVQQVNAAASESTQEGSFVTSSSSSVVAPQSAVPAPQPGLRRELTAKFLEVRSGCSACRREAFSGAWSRREWFESTLMEKDAEGLRAFVESANKKMQEDRSEDLCKYCNARVAVEPSAVKSEEGDEVKPLRHCQLCLWKYCLRHCGNAVDMAAVLDDVPLKKVPTLSCCDSCFSYVGRALWVNFAPPEGLSTLAKELFSRHQEIHAARTSLLPALEAFEEHIGSLELEYAPQPEEVIKGVRIRCDRLKQQLQMIEAAAKALDRLTDVVPKSEPKQKRVHAQLLRHANAVLLDTRTRVEVATMRGQKWASRAPRLQAVY